MKLFVWRYALAIVFSLAENEKQARKMILKDSDSWIHEVVEDGVLQVFDKPCYFIVSLYDG